MATPNTLDPMCGVWPVQCPIAQIRGIALESGPAGISYRVEQNQKAKAVYLLSANVSSLKITIK